MENQETKENNNDLMLSQNEALQLFNLLELLKRAIVKTIAPGITPADAAIAVEKVITYQEKIHALYQNQFGSPSR